MSETTSKQPPEASRVRAVALDGPIGFLAFGFGSGLSPRAPGTAGSALGLLLALPLIGLPYAAAWAVVIATFFIGIPICERASKQLGVHDHGGIVWDEFVGLWMVLLTVPLHAGWWLAAFVAFRVFDIAKPWPIGVLDRRMAGGLGIMIDDIVAALYAIALLGIARAAIG